MYASDFLANISRLARRMARFIQGPPVRRRDELLVPQLFVRRLEDRCVLNAQALNVGISAAATSSGSFAGGVYTPTSPGANVNTSDIANQLNAGTNVTITTGSTGNETGDITINAPIVWHSDATLIIHAAGSVFINAAIQNTGTGGVEIDAGGQIIETPGGTITTDTLTTNSAGGANLASLNAVGTFSATNTGGNIFLRDIAPTLTANTITVSGGNVDLAESGGSVIVGGLIDAGSGDVNIATAGTVSENGGAIAANFLTVNAVGGVELTGQNSVHNIRGSSSFGGDYVLVNSIDTLYVIGISDSGANIRITNAGSIEIRDSVNAGPGSVTLNGSGSITEMSLGRLLTDNLELLGSGDYNLTSATNRVSNLAGNVTGNVDFYTPGDLAIGTVNNTVGLTAANKSIVLSSGGNIGVDAILSGGSVDITPHDEIQFNVASGTAVLTSGDQTYNGPIRLLNNTSLVSSAAGDIHFTTTIDGARDLNVDTAGSQFYNAVVGGSTPLSGLTADAIHNNGLIYFNMPIGPGNLAGVNAGSVTLDGTTIFNIANSTTSNPSVRTSAAQTYNGPVHLLLDTALATSAGNVVLNNTVDSGPLPTSLTISAGGTIYFGDDVGSINPLSRVTSVVNQGVTIANGKSISTVTGAVSSAPPILFVLQTTPQQEQINPSNLTQTVYGYIGFAGAASGYAELGQNYNIEVLWNDGSVTMSDTQSLAIGRRAQGFGSFVGFGTVARMSSVPGSPGVWTYNTVKTILPDFLPAAPAGGITFAISHTYDVNFVSSLGRARLTAVVKLVNASSIVLSDPAMDGTIATGAPPSPNSSNAVQTSTSVPVTTGIVGVPTPVPFAPPAVVAPPAAAATPFIASTPPAQSVNQTNEFAPREEKIATERRMIEIVKLDPDGNPEKEVILTDVPEKLNELLAKLKQGAYRNGRYAVYLTEYSSTGNTVIGRRLLLEVYKSGHALGDPVHEPGPGSNPLPKDGPNSKTSEAPKNDASRGDASPKPTIEVRSASESGGHRSLARRASIAAAVAVIGGRAAASAEEEWSTRVDRALGENQLKKLRRMAWLARTGSRRK
jgi:hypothetical protein